MSLSVDVDFITFELCRHSETSSLSELTSSLFVCVCAL